MDAEACRKPASHSLPPSQPALFPVRARRSQVADLSAGGAAFSGPPDTPPRCLPLTVPFLWEEAPGKPKAAAPTDACADAAPPAANAVPVPEGGATAGDLQDSGRADQARPVPLKLPPRLQQVPASSSFAAADTAMSPKTVLQGPYYGCTGGGRRKPPRWARSGGCGAGALKRTPSAGVALFSRTWSKPKAAAAAAAGSNKYRGGDHERDTPWCSPASTDSSSSVSTCFGGDDHSHGRLADGREVSTEEDDVSPRSSVKITRFRRNRSLPSMTMTTSHLWASIRRSFKQITPWS